jgi:hypothetical protein
MGRVFFIVLAVVFCAALCGAIATAADDTVQPASCTATNFRGVASGAYASPDYFFEGTWLLLTNWVGHTGPTTNYPVQGLSNVVKEVRIGNTTSNILYTGNVQNATAGTWWALVKVPTNSGGSAWIQVRDLDSITNDYINPWLMINTKIPLKLPRMKKSEVRK